MNQIQKQSDNQFDAGIQQYKLSDLSQITHTHRQKPNLLRINADNQDKKYMCLFWSIFLLFVMALAILSKTLPKPIKLINNNTELADTSLQKCQNPAVPLNQVIVCSNLSQLTSTIGLVAKQLSSLNQFVTFWLQIYPKDIVSPLKIDQNLTYILYGLQKTENGFRKNNQHQNQTVTFTYSSQFANFIYADDRTIKGYRVFIGFIGQFPSPNILLTLQFSGPLEQLANINSMNISAYKIRKSFTVFTIVLRYIFFVLSLLTAFLYNRKYRQIPINDRIIEQKLIEIVSVLVIFFNDPFYPITVLKENMVRQTSIIIGSSFFSMLFVLVFVVYIIFLWMVFFDRILYEEGQKETHQITKFKIAYCLILLVLLLTLYMLYANYRLNNHPLIPSEILTDRRILLLDTITSLVFLAGILYIATQYIRIWCDKSERLWRSELMMSYSVLFILAMIVFVFTDNALGSYHYEGANFIFLYGLMNLYVWYMQFMYSKAADEGEKGMLNSDDMMSVGTVEFNDLNINLDENEGWTERNRGKLSETDNQQKINTKWNGILRKVVKNQEDGVQVKKKDDKIFTIEDQSQADRHNRMNSNNDKQFSHCQQIDFFKPQANNNLDIPDGINFTESKNVQELSSKNVQQLSGNEGLKNSYKILEPSCQVDQNDLEIVSETISQSADQSELIENMNVKRNWIGNENENENEKKQEDKRQDGFGEFKLE